MRLSFGQEKQLKEYLLTELEPISDADPVVLADYVLALVKQDHSIGDLKIMCMDQLIDFLLPGKTKDFVDKLFYQLEGVQPMETEDPRRQERRERPDQRQERSDRQDRSDYRQERFDQRQERFDRPDHRERQDPRDRRQKRDRFSPYQRKQERRQEYVKSKPHQLADVLHVQNIPQENCTYEQIHDYFTQFGNIINLSVDPERRTCVIQYSSSEEADKCYNSPKVIFDNRFVKVFWATLEDAQQQEMEQRRLEMEQIETEQRAIAIKEKLKQAQLQKQAQAQQQIQTRQQLIDNQLQEQQKIMKQLEDPQLGEEEKKQLLHRMKLLSDSTMSMLASQPVQAPIGTVVGEEQVDPQLANELSELKQQAQQLGVSYRGRGRGRGGIARFNLDNRPTKFLLLNRLPLQEYINHYKSMPGFTSATLINDNQHVLVGFQTRPQADFAIVRPPLGNQGAQINWFQPKQDETQMQL